MDSIKIKNMAKVYGHAGLEIGMKDGKVKQCKLNITESSRFFESLVRGKGFDEARRITSRICGICAASHNITAIMAVENALGIEPSWQVRLMREALILGGWIQSHALHAYFLALPDCMGYSGILDMADRYPEHVDRAFRLKKLGNGIIEVFGGRATHPVSTNVGGFDRIPEREELQGLQKELQEGLKDARETVKIFSGFRKPTFEREKAAAALEDGKSYAILSGEPVIGDERIPQSEFAKKTVSEQRPYSTSKFVSYKGSEYFVGPLARMNMNHRWLCPEAKSSLQRSGLELPDFNPFNANIARAIEIVHCIERCSEAIKWILRGEESAACNPGKTACKAGRGMAVTEAPRGMLYHEYTINSKGCITSSNIITPTAQNLGPMERDVRAFLPGVLKMPKEKLVLEVEKLIRSYDPCISCATHFLEVRFS